jgi:hypothetical protein
MAEPDKIIHSFSYVQKNNFHAPSLDKISLKQKFEAKVIFENFSKFENPKLVLLEMVEG